MKITFVRHGEKNGDALTEAGRLGAVELGRTVIRGLGITLVAGTGYNRVKQTAEAIIGGAGDIPATEIGTIDLLSTNPEDTDLKKLVELVGQSGGDHRIKTLMKIDETWMHEWGDRLQNLLENYVKTNNGLVPDGHLLVIAHSPIIEMLVYRLTGYTLDPLPVLGWVTVSMHEELVGMCEILRREYEFIDASVKYIPNLGRGLDPS